MIVSAALHFISSSSLDCILCLLPAQCRATLVVGGTRGCPAAGCAGHPRRVLGTAVQGPSGARMGLGGLYAALQGVERPTFVPSCMCHLPCPGLMPSLARTMLTPAASACARSPWWLWPGRPNPWKGAASAVPHLGMRLVLPCTCAAPHPHKWQPKHRPTFGPVGFSAFLMSSWVHCRGSSQPWFWCRMWSTRHL